MLKKIVFSILVVGTLWTSISAKEVNIKNVDELGWMTYKGSGGYRALLKYKNHQESMKKWYMETYHSDEYEKIKNDEFALDDAEEKYYLEFINKMKSLKANYNISKVALEGTFILNTTGKIGKYDFKKKAFVVTPEVTNEMSETRKNHYTYRPKVDGRKLVRNASILIPPLYLKMKKNDAKKLIDKLKKEGLNNKKVLLKYKASIMSASLSNVAASQTKAGPCSEFRGGLLQSQVEIIDPVTNEVIGTGKTENR